MNQCLSVSALCVFSSEKMKKEKKTVDSAFFFISPYLIYYTDGCTMNIKMNEICNNNHIHERRKNRHCLAMSMFIRVCVCVISIHFNPNISNFRRIIESAKKKKNKTRKNENFHFEFLFKYEKIAVVKK